MKYISTRGQSAPLTASQAIIKGLADDGGLYVPEFLPALSAAELASLPEKTYHEMAGLVLGRLLDDFSAAELAECLSAAYAPPAFEDNEPAKIVALDDRTALLELWHGPTCAFKDMALQLMPRLFMLSLKKNGISGRAVMLAATSGDTGKAALEGFRDLPGLSAAVLYPYGGVSEIQRLQMTTQRGDNVSVAAVRGNFDDTQNAVKRIFGDAAFRQSLADGGYFLTSANSINWGRLAPQIVYYFYACARLQAAGTLKPGDLLDVCVPTGNFGNILAGFYARCMGAPIGRLICASNRNNVLTEFIQTGRYDRNRPFYQTLSPSMDILISSNLERLLFALCRQDAATVADLMQQLSESGQYTVSDALRRGIQAIFAAGFCDDAGTLAEIGRVWRQYGYLLDPHTAVASAVLRAADFPDDRPRLIVSTASPFKFAPQVAGAIGLAGAGEGLDALGNLSAASGLPVPRSLSELGGLPERHRGLLAPDEIANWLLETLAQP